MPGTTPNLSFRYPLATEAPDGPGAILALATDLDNALRGQLWAPVLGGTAVALGGNGSSDGKFVAIGRHISAKGRLIFGSSASLGSGVATIAALPGSIDTAHSTGHGFFLPPSGNVIPVFFTPSDGANMAIRPIMGNASGAVTTLGLGFNLGTPPQSSQLIFTLDLVIL